MKLTIRLFVLSLSLFTLFSLIENKSSFNVKAAPKGSLQYYGCWSPYPNCAGASDVFVDDSTGKVYQCGSCNGVADHCRESSPVILDKIGYWCS